MSWQDQYDLKENLGHEVAFIMKKINPIINWGV
jgi:hypothetical protein